MISSSVVDKTKRKTSFPHMITSGADDIITHVQHHFKTIEDLFQIHGAILFRGFSIASVEVFQRVSECLCAPLMPYTGGHATRDEVGHNVYTANHLPSNQTISLHHEMSYAGQWPRKLLFYCKTPAHTGGQTPLADSREVFRNMPDEIIREFLEKGLLYTRNFSASGLGVSWQKSFNTQDKATVEQHCSDNDIEWQWLPDGGLKTFEKRCASILCPDTAQPLWFNHAELFDVSTLGKQTKANLLSLMPLDELPHQIAFGDGSSIPEVYFDKIREIYKSTRVYFDWRKDDLLLINNMRFMHGRMPFEGERLVLVAMGDAVKTEDVCVT